MKARVAATLSVILVSASLFLSVVPSQSAHAVPPQHTWSYYVQTTEWTHGYQIGCGQANASIASGQHAMVILDFGAQMADNSGVLLPGNDSYRAYWQVAGYAQQVARGYSDCIGSRSMTLSLGVGTNTSNPPGAGYWQGAAWGTVVDDVSNWVSTNANNVYIYGANDIEDELGWASYPQVNSWYWGYADRTVRRYYNFGAASGCPAASGYGVICGNGFTMGDIRWISWDAPRAMAAPEIYNLNHASAWQRISRLSTPITYNPMSTPELSTPAQAWTWLGCGSGMSCRFLTDIRWPWQL